MELLRTKEVVELLRRRSVEVSDRTIVRYVREGFIPVEYVIIKRRGRRKYFLFKPEVVDYLEKKLSA